jgi:SET domain-containing protein
MKRTISQYVAVRLSGIHSKGIFAKKDIPKETRVIEYVGEKITKAESERRALIPLNKSKKNKKFGAVYLFELNKRHDIDGKVTYNTARFINHSCDPNCETHLIRGHIWIVSIKKIKKGTELCYNYGYTLEDYKDHECRCGSVNCVGYILDEKHWHKIKIPIKK